jgi:hypothetical protein
MPQDVGRVIGRARRRIRLQRAIEGATLGLLAAALASLVMVLLFKLRVVDEAALVAFGVGAAGAVVLGALVGALLKVPVIAAARALDARADLADRLGSAWDFGHSAERTPFMEAAIRDASRAASGLRVGTFLHLRAPSHLRAVILLLCALGLLTVLRIPIDEDSIAAVAPRPPPPPPPLVPPFQAALAQKKVEESQKEAKRLEDRKTQKILQKLERLWQDIASRKFDRRALWRRIAALQRPDGAKLSEDEKAELGRLKKTGEAMKTAAIGRRLGDALGRQDLEEAQRALRDLARRLQDKRLSKKERSELERALKRATEKTRKELSSMRRKLEQLKKQLAKRKLETLAKNKKQRELERLSKELEKLQSMLSTKLSQELMDALRKMKKYEDADAGRSLEKAAERMKQLMKRLRQLRLAARTKDHIREMKELLRRGNQGQRDDQLRDFTLRAGNGQGEDITLLLPGQGKEGEGQGDQGDDGRSLKRPGTCGKCGGGHPTKEHGQAGKQGQQGGPSDGQGPGIGTGSNMKLGQATDLKDARYKDEQLRGKKGRGESTSEIFMGAATKGFSRVGYKNVYLRYKEAVEEALEKNKGIPHGYKRIVEKYFEMIQPR